MSSTSSLIRSTGRGLAVAIGAAAGAYAAYVAITWCRYGRGVRAGSPEQADALLDRFMPQYDVVERHQVQVAAPAAITLAAATEISLLDSAIVRGLIRARELVLGAAGTEVARPRGLLAEVTAMGWGVLAEVPGREIVAGAVTQPWLPDVVFRPVPPDTFTAFREPGYVKIAWTLRADPLGPTTSVFRTETRVTATDAEARARFRSYWARFSPGITLIRRVMLGPVKREAERRAARSVAPV